MKRSFAHKAVFLAALILSGGTLFAQTGELQPVPYGPGEFPSWQKDLRRAEILSFGALPFVTFISSIYYDIYRYAQNDGNEAYLPWPLKKTEIAIPLTEREQKNILYASVGISLGVAVFDFGWRTISRAIRESRIEKINASKLEPITIREVE